MLFLSIEFLTVNYELVETVFVFMKAAPNFSGYSCRNVQGAYAKSVKTSDVLKLDCSLVYLCDYKSIAYFYQWMWETFPT